MLATRPLVAAATRAVVLVVATVLTLAISSDGTDDHAHRSLALRDFVRRNMRLAPTQDTPSFEATRKQTLERRRATRARVAKAGATFDSPSPEEDVHTIAEDHLYGVPYDQFCASGTPTSLLPQKSMIGDWGDDENGMEYPTMSNGAVQVGGILGCCPVECEVCGGDDCKEYGRQASAALGAVIADPVNCCLDAVMSDVCETPEETGCFIWDTRFICTVARHKPSRLSARPFARALKTRDCD